MTDGPDAADRRRQADAELVEEIDPDGRVVGLVDRATMRARNLRHRCVVVVLVRSTGRVVVHRRADWKDVWPGRWDVAFGGVVEVGEHETDAARRELAEEAGLDVAPGDLVDLGSAAYEDADVAWVGRVYRVDDDRDVHLVDDEVAEVAEVALADLARWAEGVELCPDTEAVVLPRLLT